jgi:hypothetical protein
VARRRAIGLQHVATRRIFLPGNNEVSVTLRIVRFAALALALGAAGASSRPASAAAYATVTIDDPMFQMPADTMRIPSGWKFQGTVVENAPCNPSPSIVYRAYSADGLSEMRSAPRFDWTFWATTFPMPKNQCPPLKRVLSATEFASYYAGIMGAKRLGPMSVGPATQRRVDLALAQRRDSPVHPEITGGVAAERVVTKNGTFAIEQRVLATVICTKQTIGQIKGFTQCQAFIQVARAPKGRLDALVREIDDDQLGLGHQFPAYAQRLEQWREAGYAALRDRGIEDMQRSNALIRSSFEQSMALQQHEHEQFMAQMQSETDASMRNAISSRDARSTAASDWTDYALDQQTVTGSGGTAKVSNAYSQTWSNGQGQYYQTNYVNADPNGSFPGNWTRQTVVHGNGTPK